MQISKTHILFSIEHKEHMKYWNWDILPFHGKYRLILTLIAATHLKKAVTVMFTIVYCAYQLSVKFDTLLFSIDGSFPGV